MLIRRIYRQTLQLLCACLIASCAATGRTDAQRNSSDATNLETMFLAEVSFILNKDEVLAGELGFGRVKDFYNAVLAEGFTDAEIDAGQVIAIRWSVYWVNTASGNTHNRIGVALLPKGMKTDPGNVVEVRYLGPSRFPRVANVRANSMQDGQCQYVETHDPFPSQVTKDILGLISLIGPPGTSTLYCKGIENEGWVIEGRQWIKQLLPTSKKPKSSGETNDVRRP